MDPERRLAAATSVEAWFVRRGLPNLIAGYRVSTDVFTRAAPFRRGGCGGVRRGGRPQPTGRRILQLPDKVGWPELAVFVLVPPLIPVLWGGDTILESAGLIVTNLVNLGVVAFGLIPMTTTRRVCARRWFVGSGGTWCWSWSSAS